MPKEIFGSRHLRPWLAVMATISAPAQKRASRQSNALV
jgi:hypothetical protein